MGRSAFVISRAGAVTLAELASTGCPGILVPLPSAAENHQQANAERFAPSGGKGFMKSDTAFFHSGTSGKWVGKLTGKELNAYDVMMDTYLKPEERAWLEYGAEWRALN